MCRLPRAINRPTRWTNCARSTASSTISRRDQRRRCSTARLPHPVRSLVTFAIGGGIGSSTARSSIISRKCRSLLAASKSSDTNSPRIWSSACASGPRRACARGVSSMRAPVRTSRGSPIRSRSRCKAWLVAGCDNPIRIAARLTLASLQKRLELQQIEVKRIQIHKMNIYHTCSSIEGMSCGER